MSRIESLLRAMTLEEKLGQLNLVTAGQAATGPIVPGETTQDIRAGQVGGVFNLWGRDVVARTQRLAVEETRLGVPLIFGLDILHGYRTIFPVPLAETGAFDPLLWERTARASALEAACEGIHLSFAPMLDVSRDPRWGRIAEGPGEDPFVGSKFAQAKIRGFQGERLSDRGALAATAKHFCAGGAATAGRDYAAVDVSERMLHEVYLPPFRAAVEAGCAAIMSAFNNVNGVPMTSHGKLLNGYLRRKLDFDGVIMSDYTAVTELVEHGVAADLVEAAALALTAGVDMDMVSGAYLRCLPEALARGLVAEADIDAAVARVLRLKERLGLFDDPYRFATPAEGVQEAHRQLALDAARRAITLLSNRGILPLAADVRRIAVIGPLADARADMLGPWSAAGAAENCVTILEGLKAALPAFEIIHCAGVSIEGDDESGIEQARALARDVDVVVLCLGESAGMSGEAASRATPGLAWKATPACGKHNGDRRADGRTSFLRTPIDRALAFRTGAGRARHMVAWRYGGPCHRRCADGPLQSLRAACRHLAARCRAGSDFLCVAIDGPPAGREQFLQQQISRSVLSSRNFLSATDFPMRA